MSNGSSSDGATQGALNDVTASDNTAVTSITVILGALSAIVATVQPYAAAVVAIIALVEDLIQFGQPDPTTSALANINAKVQQIFEQLNANDAGLVILNRNGTVYTDLVNSITAVQNLQASLNNPVEYPPGPLIENCVGVINNFSSTNDFAWNTTFSSQQFENTYWTDVGEYQGTCYYPLVGGGYEANNFDAGYGQRQPPLNPDGVTVFDYRYSLPAFLYAVSNFLAVGGALDPNFAADQSESLGAAAQVMGWVHNQIASGIILLSPPNWTSLGLQLVACPAPVGGTPPPPAPGVRLTYSSLTVVGATIEYGAVEKFSGASSVGGNYQITLSGSTSEFNPAPFNKLQIRLLKRTKDVYAAVGLISVLQSINKLNAVLKQPPIPTPTITWLDGSLINLSNWSFRQLFGLSKLTKNATGAYSLRALANFLIQTQPSDTPYTNAAPNVTLSFSQLLTNFSD